MRILVVDDNENNRRLLRATLAALGHETVECANGLEALDALEASTFDALISDVLMPGMDGYRLCTEVRAEQTSFRASRSASPDTGLERNRSAPAFRATCSSVGDV